jgi:hypothetical protein
MGGTSESGQMTGREREKEDEDEYEDEVEDEVERDRRVNVCASDTSLVERACHVRQGNRAMVRKVLHQAVIVRAEQGPAAAETVSSEYSWAAQYNAPNRIDNVLQNSKGDSMAVECACSPTQFVQSEKRVSRGARQHPRRLRLTAA